MILYKQTTAKTKLSMNYNESFQNGDIHNFSCFFNGLFSFTDYYDRTVSLKNLKFVIQAKITNINVELRDEVDSLNRLKRPKFRITADLLNFYHSEPKYKSGSVQTVTVNFCISLSTQYCYRLLV